MKPWVKLWTEILHDRKMHQLTDRQFRVCLNLFAMAGIVDDDGELMPFDDMAFQLRMDPADLLSDLHVLRKANIVDEQDGEWWLVHYEFRQPQPPSAKPAAVLVRVHKHRAKLKAERNALRNDGVTSVTTLQKSVTSVTTEIREEEKREEEMRATAEVDIAWAAAVKFFQDNISLISSSMLPDMLDVWSMLEVNDCAGWWNQAIAIAAARNKRNWAYVRTVLQNCLSEGHPPQSNGSGPKPRARRSAVTKIQLPDGSIQDVKQ